MPGEARMWTDVERAAIAASGRDPEEIEGQVRLLRSGGRRARLERPCTVGDGIVEVSAPEALEAAARDAAARGRLSVFVPASGAASRMFDSLTRLIAVTEGPLPLVRVRRLADVDRALDRAARILEELPHLALWGPLSRSLERHGVRWDLADLRPVTEVLCAPDGVASWPKALLPFHLTPSGPRPPIVSHLLEAAELVADRSGRVSAHFTLPPAHHRAALAALADVPGADRFAVSFSEQDPSTDTVALQDDRLVVEGGQVLFRPGGHGALLRNLGRCGGDVVLVKNIDNVGPDSVRAEVSAWRRRLAGLLLRAESDVHGAVRALRDGRPGAPSAAGAVLRRWFGVEDPPADSEALLGALERPLRVAGMVPHDGQPGGGPFWVRGQGKQIVERVQVDVEDPDQRRVLEASTHFNPVDLAVSLRDAWGQPFDLGRFSDGDAVILNQKLHRGRPMTVLELPGLWNGAMAGWLSIFVHLPRHVFHPVKTLADLLLPPHRAAE